MSEQENSILIGQVYCKKVPTTGHTGSASHTGSAAHTGSYSEKSSSQEEPQRNVMGPGKGKPIKMGPGKGKPIKMGPGKGKSFKMPLGMLPPAPGTKGSTWSQQEINALVFGVEQFRSSSSTQTEIFKKIKEDHRLGPILAARSLKALITKYGKGVHQGLYCSLKEKSHSTRHAPQVGQHGFMGPAAGVKAKAGFYQAGPSRHRSAEAGPSAYPSEAGPSGFAGARVKASFYPSSEARHRAASKSGFAGLAALLLDSLVEKVANRIASGPQVASREGPGLDPQDNSGIYAGHLLDLLVEKVAIRTAGKLKDVM